MNLYGAWQNGVQSFANSGSFGVMGEAGPEAIMPLTRAPNGKLGVMAHGSGGGTTIINNISVVVEGGDKDVKDKAEEGVTAALGKMMGEVADSRYNANLANDLRFGGRIYSAIQSK